MIGQSRINGLQIKYSKAGSRVSKKLLQSKIQRSKGCTYEKIGTSVWQVKDAVDDYMDCYNNEHYVWSLAYLSPNEYYQFYVTGKYPLQIPNSSKPPMIEKKPKELGEKKDSDASEAAENKCS